jgi:hypothetical protein
LEVGILTVGSLTWHHLLAPVHLVILLGTTCCDEVLAPHGDDLVIVDVGGAGGHTVGPEVVIAGAESILLFTFGFN